MLIVSGKPKILENYNSFCLASESNERNSRDKALGLPFFFHYKHTTSLKSRLSLLQGESLPCWFWGNFCNRVCFDLLVERISFVCSR